MPVRASDIILDWIHDDGYSIAENGWVRARDRKFYFEITAEKDGRRHIARARDREQHGFNPERITLPRWTSP